jgi:tetratricopeptide (TPR) repeat protein
MRNPKWQFPIVLLILLAAIFGPVLYSGYKNIKQAEAAFSAKNYTDAAASFESAARLLPWRADLWEQAGQAAFYGQDYPESIRLYEKAKSAASLSNRNWNLFGWSYWMTENHAEAQAIWQAGADAYSSYTPFYDALSMSYREQKNYTAERDVLQRWVALEPQSAQAHYRLGLILTVLDSEKAITDLMLASSLDPQFDPAVQTLRTALNLSATQADASRQMVTIGRALGLVNEWALSASAFQKALDLDEKNAEAWAWLGEAKQQRGEYGRVELDQALTLNGQSVIVRALRGLYWNRQGKYSQALTEYQLAAGIETENPAWQASIGDAYTRLGDLAAALAAYQHAAQLAPDEATYWMWVCPPHRKRCNSRRRT